MNYTIPIDSKATVRALNEIQRKQLPFAIANALTQTAKKAQRDLSKATAKYFDRPTPFTKKAFGITPATKRHHQADVHIKPIQWTYMFYEVEGGVRTPKHTAIPVPTNNLTDRNRYGGMRRRKVDQLLRHPDVFSGTVKGIGGIWMRTGGTVRLLVAWEKQTTYRPRFPFTKIARASVRKNYPRIFRRSLNRALKTAK